MTCTSCGARNREGARFCDSCGAALAVEPARELRARAAAGQKGSTVLLERIDELLATTPSAAPPA